MSVNQAAQRRTWFTQYQTSDVSKNLEVSGTKRTVQGNDFGLIPVVKMKTRYPVEGSFGSEFSAICNHCGVMVASSRKM